MNHLPKRKGITRQTLPIEEVWPENSWTLVDAFVMLKNNVDIRHTSS